MNHLILPASLRYQPLSIMEDKGRCMRNKMKQNSYIKLLMPCLMKTQISYCQINWFSSPESLHELEDNDLDALMSDLMADLNATEVKLAAEIKGLKVPSPPSPDLPPPPMGLSTYPASSLASPTPPTSRTSSTVSTPASSASSPLPPPPSQSTKPSKVSQPMYSL